MLWEMLNDIIARPSNFKRLKKRRRDTIPLSHFGVSLGAALVTAIASLAAIDYLIIHRLLKNSVRSSGGIVLITITILFLDIFIAAGLTLFFGGIWYLTYKHILVPLYHRNYIRSFEAHIRQKSLQSSLQKSWSPLSTRDLLSTLTRHWRDWSDFSERFFKKRPRSDVYPELPMSTWSQGKRS